MLIPTFLLIAFMLAPGALAEQGVRSDGVAESAPSAAETPTADAANGEADAPEAAVELPAHLPVPERTFTIRSIEDLRELDRKLDDAHEETFGR